MRKRRKFTAAFKSKVAREARREDRPLSETAAHHKIHPIDSGPAREDRGVDDRADSPVQGARALSRTERLGMIEQEDPELSLSRKCRLLDASLEASLARW